MLDENATLAKSGVKENDMINLIQREYSRVSKLNFLKMTEETKTSKGSAYIPPHKRRVQAPPSSKFDTICSSEALAGDSKWRGANSRKSETEWGSRDNRTGYLDRDFWQEAEDLLEAHDSNTGMAFGKCADIPVDINSDA